MNTMRKVAWITMSLLFLGTSASLAGETAWFDMSCEMCKNFVEQPGLMEAMEHQSYEISNGCVMVTVVEDAHAGSYDKAMQACRVTGDKMMAGEQMHLCGMCSSIGQSMAMGAQMDMVDTEAGHLMILTSGDPKVVEQIHSMVAKNREELKKMMGQG